MVASIAVNALGCAPVDHLPWDSTWSKDDVDLEFCQAEKRSDVRRSPLLQIQISILSAVGVLKICFNSFIYSFRNKKPSRYSRLSHHFGPKYGDDGLMYAFGGMKYGFRGSKYGAFRLIHSPPMPPFLSKKGGPKYGRVDKNGSTPPRRDPLWQSESERSTAFLSFQRGPMYGRSDKRLRSEVRPLLSKRYGSKYGSHAKSDLSSRYFWQKGADRCTESMPNPPDRSTVILSEYR